MRNGTSLMRRIWPIGLFVAEDLARGRASDDADLVRAAHILRGEGRAVAQRPLPDVEVIRRLAVDAGEPILIAGRDLAASRSLPR